MAQERGQRTSAQIINASLNIRDVAPGIFYLDPDVAPLITLLNKLDKKKDCKSTKYEWHESDYVARWSTIGATTVTTSNTEIIVTDGTLFRVGSMFCVPNAVSSSTAPELIRVREVSTHTLKVDRAVGGGVAGTINAGAAIRTAGTAHPEGGTFPEMLSTTPSNKYSYTQIFRTPIEASMTSLATDQYGMAELKRLQKEKSIEHKESINSAFLFGKSSESLTGGGGPVTKPIRTTMGLFNFITTNVYNGNTTLTRKTIDRFAEMAFRYGNQKQKVLLASPRFISAISGFARSHLQIEPTSKSYGVSVQKVVTGHGEWMLVRDWMLEDGVSGGNGFLGNAFSLDLDQFSIRVLNNNGINRDTKYLQDSIQDGSDRRCDEYLTEIGLEVHNEKYHARMYNVTDYSE